MARYTVELFDANDNRIAMLEPISPEYRRRANQATGFSFGVLADDESVGDLQAARHCILYRDGVEKAAGYITARDFTANPYRIECITNEALLRRIIVPRAWKRWNGMDLADAVRDLLLGFKTQVANTASDWNAAIEKWNVDLTTWPGKVVLAKDANGAYYPHGYITVQFDFGAITRYDLLRWAEDVGEAVRIRAQFRTSPDGVTWSAWSPELASVFPAEDGVALTGNDRFIQVKLHLYTDDTTSKDPNGVPTGYTPILNGVEVIARVPGPVSEGSIPTSTGVTLQGYTFNRENALRILQTWCEEYGYEFAVDGAKRLHFAQTLGSVKNVVLRRTSTMDIQRLQDNADELENVVLCLGAGEGPAQLQTVLTDADSVAAFGEHPGVLEDSQADTMDKLIAAGNKYLQEHAWPKEEFVASRVPVWELEDFGIYDTVTVVDPLRGIVTTARILDEERKCDTSGEDVTLGLNTTLDNIIERIVKGRIPKPGSSGIPPAAPVDVRATGGYTYILVTWRGEGDYFIVEHSTDGATWNVLDRPTSTSYLHSQLAVGTTHYYRVYAVKGRMMSAPSAVVSATVSNVPPGDLDLLPPATPTGLNLASDTVITTANIIIVRVIASWNANTEEDLKEYYLRRSEDQINWSIVAAVPAGTTSYVDTQGLKDHTRYYYQIAAADKTGNMSPWSGSVYVDTTPDATPPNIPSNPPTVLIGKKLLSVVLPGSDDLDLAVYKIQRREAPAEWDAANGVWKVPTNPAWGAWADVPGGLVRAETWQDVNVEYSKCYSYRYCAIDTSMNPSQWSDPSPGAVPSQTGEQDLAVRSIHAQMYYEIRNVMPYNYLDSLDSSKPFECDFYIPSETTGIVSIKLSARGLRYRAYSKAALLFEIFGSPTSSVGDHSHGVDSLMGTTLTTSAAGAVSAHTHSFEDTIPSSSTGSAGSHSHGVTYNFYAYTSYGGDPSHYHGYDRANGTSSAGDHYHGISTTTTSKSTGSAGAISAHSHTVTVGIQSAGAHNHTINLSHGHGLEFGIYEDTTPAGVKLYCDNGAGYDAGQSLAAAPDTTTPYTLCTELDLTSKFTGTGWKRIKFTSTRLGRIAAVLIVKVDVSA
ncbi:MAG: hypothetical protein HPY52_10835 [Firmicutes bacterium]|nr:hypothetical protein [Bacillota bacterium]